MRVPVRISNPSDESLTLDIPDALVSKALTHLLLPAAIAEALKLPRVNDRQSLAEIRIGEHRGVTTATLTDTPELVVLGSFALTSVGLQLDASGEQLIELEHFLLAAR